ncbi:MULTISPECIES: ATP synthase subunit I [unclassified Moraxella]|uniref:ATP synthase subunit I n=1 Tax=unclassified Moraxella TaxID=2685852 RepID=UPI003AF89923
MTQPAKRFQAQPLFNILKQQAWVLFGVMIIALIIDFSLQQSQQLITKNVLAGGVLAWCTQYIFAKIALRQTGYRQRKQIVHNFYQAQAIKWGLVMLGFAFIFLTLKPLAPIYVLGAFILLQLTHFLWLLKNKT